ncbi:RloB domain-containing protein [Sphingobium sp. AR-3-1]|uniref:RloB domain-containing protein n=1 Tax=Sphingobium psychrophilum TaxID=2728834 RepID=A0A7X9ZUY3_9SPHN|nr:RloB family protein [Sphingobium psychrophilum]NML13237.1 RloB domain-containing protein [Sphingobium psychrophilum]
MPKPRKPATQIPEKTMKIFCEGEKTEPNYINSYLDHIGSTNQQSVVRVEKTRKNTPVQLVEAAINAKNNPATLPDDIFWVVYDRENVAKYTDALHAKARKMADQKGINIALSNVCFEYWILLHLVDTQAPYSDFKDLKKTSALNAEFKKLDCDNYEKSSATIFDIVKHGLDNARTRAVRLNAAGKQNAQHGRDQDHQINPYMGMVDLLDDIDNF